MKNILNLYILLSTCILFSCSMDIQDYTIKEYVLENKFTTDKEFLIDTLNTNTKIPLKEVVSRIDSILYKSLDFDTLFINDTLTINLIGKETFIRNQESLNIIKYYIIYSDFIFFAVFFEKYGTIFITNPDGSKNLRLTKLISSKQEIDLSCFQNFIDTSFLANPDIPFPLQAIDSVDDIIIICPDG